MSWDTARPEQRINFDDAWAVWAVVTGRGWGKRRTACEAIKKAVEEHGIKTIALVGRTLQEVRELMVEAPSGILSVCADSKNNRPTYCARLRQVVWPCGTRAHIYTDRCPDQLRGVHADLTWLLKAILKRPLTKVTFGSTFDNLGNLPRVFARVAASLPASESFDKGAQDELLRELALDRQR